MRVRRTNSRLWKCGDQQIFYPKGITGTVIGFGEDKGTIQVEWDQVFLCMGDDDTHHAETGIEEINAPHDQLEWIDPRHRMASELPVEHPYVDHRNLEEYLAELGITRDVSEKT